MSTIKSSTEHLTLNADGSGKDIKFQANGVEKASISSAGAFTSTSIDATKLSGTVPNFTSTGIDDNATSTAITIDSGGRVTHSSQPAFLVGFTTSGTESMNDNEIFPFNADSGGALFDQGNNFTTSSYRFTAPVSGLYHFDCTIYKSTVGGYSVQLKKNGGGITNAQDTIASFENDLGSMVLSVTLDLAANDYIDAYTRNGSYTYYKNHSYWSGYLIG